MTLLMLFTFMEFKTFKVPLPYWNKEAKHIILYKKSILAYAPVLSFLKINLP